jgi:hypothetical protein
VLAVVLPEHAVVRVVVRVVRVVRVARVARVDRESRALVVSEVHCSRDCS